METRNPIAAGSSDCESARLAGRTVMVTGGAGLIGSRIVARLRAAGARALVLDRLDAYPPGTLDLFGVRTDDRDLYAGDITDRATVRELVAQSDAVIHAAAFADVAACTRNPGKAFQANVKGTQVLLEEVLRSRVRRFVFASSASVYGDPLHDPKGAPRFIESQPVAPLSVYGNSKAWGETQVRLLLSGSDVEHTVLRYFSVYGEPQIPKRDSHSWAVAWFAMHAATGRVLQLHNGGRQVRDFVHVDDVADATLLAVSRPGAAGQTINVGTGTATSIRTVADLVREHVADTPLTITPRPDGDPLGGSADIGRAAEVLGWQPSIQLAEGVRRYAAWLARTPQAVPSWLNTPSDLVTVA